MQHSEDQSKQQNHFQAQASLPPDVSVMPEKDPLWEKKKDLSYHVSKSVIPSLNIKTPI